MLLRLITLLITLSLSANVGAYDDHICSQSENEMQCVLKFYPAIYQENPKYFWKVLNQAQKDALDCTSNKAATNFLRLVTLVNPSVELEEFVSEGVEKLCVDQPVCFKKALVSLRKGARLEIKRRLKNPTFFEHNELLGCYKK